MQRLVGMCLGVPGRIVSIDGDIALVDFWGVVKPVRIDVVDAPVAPGDYVLNHVGFAIRRIAPEDLAETVQEIAAELETNETIYEETPTCRSSNTTLHSYEVWKYN